MIFSHSTGFLKFSEGVVERMIRLSQTNPLCPEAGGILLGRLILDGDDVVVDDITLPAKEDKRNRFSFRRSAKAHQLMLNNEWLSSGRTCNYLGEWHTHPEARPLPSRRDMKSWRSQCLKMSADRNALFFAIVGIESIGVWKAHPKPFKIQQLTQL